jgi:hypothetical protein
MNSPIQAAPVLRGYARTHQMQSLRQQGCNWFECAGVAIACAAACVITEGEACIECLGPAYASCKDCF